MNKTNVVIGVLGVIKDNKGRGARRWQVWRPTISAHMQSDFVIDRYELLYEPAHLPIALSVVKDIKTVSPDTEVRLIEAVWEDAWDFAQVYDALYQFADHYDFNTDTEDYFLNITTGSHVNQICMFMLSEAQIFPSRLIQVSPDRSAENPATGTVDIIDLDLSKYAALAARFSEQSESAQEFLKAGIQTKNEAFNQIIHEIEQVAIATSDPLLLEGPTGAGKTQLARRIYELKSSRGGVQGSFVAVNCATLIGDGAMSALFGHTRGAFTGAQNARDGYLKKANTGILFLDEIGELGLDEQAMLLHAIEDKEFYPVGSDKTIYSDFQLLAGTNLDLANAVEKGEFREDLLARINMWNWRLPSLKERLEDFEANLEFELRQYSRLTDSQIRMGREARQEYLRFAHSPNALWSANFRDLNASVRRMATLSKDGRISSSDVQHEVLRLQKRWHKPSSEHGINLSDYLDDEAIDNIDLFDRIQLTEVIKQCQLHSNMAEAGRVLFNVSRTTKTSINDSNRLRVYLNKFGLRFSDFTQNSTN